MKFHEMIPELLDAVLSHDRETLDVVTGDLEQTLGDARKEAKPSGRGWKDDPLYRLGGAEVLLELVRSAERRLIDPGALRLLQQKSTCELLKAARENPGSSLKALATSLGKASSNISAKVKGLEQVGLITSLKEGTTKKIFPTTHGVSMLEIASDPEMRAAAFRRRRVAPEDSEIEMFVHEAARARITDAKAVREAPKSKRKGRHRVRRKRPAGVLGEAGSKGRKSKSLAESIAKFETDLVRRALHRCSGDRSRAAELLGLSTRQMSYRLGKLGKLNLKL